MADVWRDKESTPTSKQMKEAFGKPFGPGVSIRRSPKNCGEKKAKLLRMVCKGEPWGDVLGLHEINKPTIWATRFEVRMKLQRMQEEDERIVVGYLAQREREASQTGKMFLNWN